MSAGVNEFSTFQIWRNLSSCDKISRLNMGNYVMQITVKNRILIFVIMMVVVPLLAESIYSPGLPALAESFGVSDGLAESTLSIYLFGMSIGVLCWGNLSDLIGRKPVVLIGCGMFLFSSIVCYWTTTFSWFMFWRFFQAFGGSVSCVAQSVNRDVFDQRERMALSAKIGTAVSIAPAIGAMVGGVITEHFGWRQSFLFLIVVACAITALFVVALPETKKGPYLRQDRRSFFAAILSVVSDVNLLFNATIIGLGLGILYTFMSEGAFYCIEALSMSSEGYGMICAAGSLVYALGCSITSQLINRGIRYQQVMLFGVAMMCFGFVLFDVVIYMGLLTKSAGGLDSQLSSFLVLATLWVFSSLGLSFTLTPCFANALEYQRENAGVAASMFAFSYNLISTLVLLVMSSLHAEHLYAMPTYFFAVTLLIWIACEILFRSQRVTADITQSAVPTIETA